MTLKPVLTAALLAVGVSSASAWTTLDLGPATLAYDETTSFGYIAGSFSSALTYGFHWTVPSAAAVSSFGPLTIVNVPMPSYTLTVNPGWSVSNATTFLGNLAFVEVGPATTNIVANANVSVNGGPSVPVGPNSLGWTTTSSGPGFSQGYFSDTKTLPGPFNSIAVTGAGIDLSATGGFFSSIAANPQNQLEVSFAAVAVPVPEPETYAMLLAGLGALGMMAKRRRPQA